MTRVLFFQLIQRAPRAEVGGAVAVMSAWWAAWHGWLASHHRKHRWISSPPFREAALQNKLARFTRAYEAARFGKSVDDTRSLQAFPGHTLAKTEDPTTSRTAQPRAKKKLGSHMEAGLCPAEQAEPRPTCAARSLRSTGNA